MTNAAQCAAADTRRTPSPMIVFLVLAIPFGVAFAFVTPPLDAPDEPRHLARAWLISEGRMTVPGFAPGHGATLPVELLRLHAPRGPGLCKHDRTALGASPNRALDAGPRADSTRLSTPFVPVAYLPQSFALMLGRKLDMSATGLIRFGRLANVLAWCTLAAWAIGAMPLRRWPLVAVALTPIAVFLSGSLTADAFTNGLAFAFCALTLQSAVGEEARGGGRLPVRREALLIGMAALVALAKPGYWPLAALLGAIPLARFGTRRRWLVVMGTTAAVVVLPSAIWIVATQRAEPFALGPGADATAQIRFVLGSPLTFVTVLLDTAIHDGIAWVAGFVGVLGALDVVLPLPIYAIYPAALLTLCLVDGPDSDDVTSTLRWRSVSLFGVSFMVILAMGYVGWNPVGSGFIADIHGRYFLPIAPLLLLAIPAVRLRPRWVGWGVLIFCAGVLTIALERTFARYYLP